MGRFLNADGFNDEGLVISDPYMFAYCRNNPVMGSDPTGCTWQDFLQQVEASMQRLQPTFASVGQWSTFDGPYPIMDAIALVAFAAIAAYGVVEGAKSYAEAIAVAQSPTRSDSYAQEREKEAVRTKKRVIFPENPNKFCPRGLELRTFDTPNGPIYKWMSGKKAIFEWDFDFIYGPHYHVMQAEWNSQHLLKDHWKAGMEVPEPWASLYF